MRAEIVIVDMAFYIWWKAVGVLYIFTTILQFPIFLSIWTTEELLCLGYALLLAVNYVCASVFFDCVNYCLICIYFLWDAFYYSFNFSMWHVYSGNDFFAEFYLSVKWLSVFHLVWCLSESRGCALQLFCFPQAILLIFK